MLKFKSLGSGSSGNATLVEATAGPGSTPVRLLVDCGLGIRQLALRLGEAGLQIEDLDAVFITHEHGDHIGCARTVALRYRIPVWMSQGTHAAIGSADFEGLLRTACDGAAIDLGGLQLTPFAVPHDAREPLQLSCTDGAVKLGVLTDLGHATAHVMAHLQSCHALLLECNHDLELLAGSAYPDFLKRRVGGQHGHLSNIAAAEIARALQHAGLRHLVAAHLSAHNNRPELAQEALSQVTHFDKHLIGVADARTGTPWLQV
ncbi:MBL fold metallo-hydrolase [Polaromonas sp.]|uniref:MBL fold metallo-hydrolase n=1 Tax=Polaromonas sp. TaxID=1869339 RepID=UPI00286D0145|nr:MBL fold metallo-hydrolase [Polaromonas sp.]